MTMVPSVSFVKYTNINEQLNVHKNIVANVDVHGNSAVSNATADALGHNTTTETLTQTTVAQGYGSSSVSESLSATSGSYFHW